MYPIIKFTELDQDSKDYLLAKAEQGVKPTAAVKSLILREAHRVGDSKAPQGHSQESEKHTA